MAPIAPAALVGSIGPRSTFLVAVLYAVLLATMGLVASPLRRIEEGISYAVPPRSLP
jgi:hypothetical protein